MRFKSLTAMLLAAAALTAPAVINADEAPAKQRPEKRQFRGPGERGERGGDRSAMRGGQGMRGGMFMQRNPEMMTARLVMKELRAYQAEPNDANYAALEKALNEAIKKDTAMRKERLEKQLMELEKNQAERAQNLLKKVKSGEFKMPEARREGNERRRVPAERKERRGGKREKAEK